MPKASTSRSGKARTAPYKLRSVSSSTQNKAMTASLVSPVPDMNWSHMPSNSSNPWHSSQQMHYPPQPVMHDYAQPVTTPTLSVAPTSARPVSSSGNNGGSGPWTTEMDDILIENARRFKWDQIAEYFFHNTKSGNACRKRYARVQLERREPTRWNPDRIQKVVSAYNSDGMRQRMWGVLADDVQERWEDIERLCFTQGLRAMTSGTASGHARRRSQVPSHHSYGSDFDHSGHDDTHHSGNDSGLGPDLDNAHYSHIPVSQGGPVSAAGPYHIRMSSVPDHGYEYSPIYGTHGDVP